MKLVLTVDIEIEESSWALWTRKSGDEIPADVAAFVMNAIQQYQGTGAGALTVNDITAKAKRTRR